MPYTGKFLSEEARVAFEENKPFIQYRKATIGKISIRTIDPLTGDEVEKIIEGTPGINKCLIPMWSAFEDTYFKRNNDYHFKQGNLIVNDSSVAMEEEESPIINNISDEEIKSALSDKFFTVKNILDKLTSVTPVQRMLAIAEEMNRPIGTINAIKAKLSKLQEEEFK